MPIAAKKLYPHAGAAGTVGKAENRNYVDNDHEYYDDSDYIDDDHKNYSKGRESKKSNRVDFHSEESFGSNKSLKYEDVNEKEDLDYAKHMSRIVRYNI
jgi:hypothetical protein